MAVFLLTATVFGQNASTPTPPVAETIHKERAINDRVLVDDYGWLRERTNPKVRAYLEAENAYAEEVTADEKPFAEKLYNETLRSHQADGYVGALSEARLLVLHTDGRRKAISDTVPEERDADCAGIGDAGCESTGAGEKFMSLGAEEVSDDSSLLAFTTDNVGFRQYKLRVKDLRTGKLLPDTAEVPGYDISLYAVERLFVPARDGVGVPVTVAYRKDKYKEGESPLFVYGYGSYGVTIPDTFSTTALPILDRGVVTSVAHIRGGGELGEAWHDAGKMMTKRNTFTDFIDVTEGLLAQGYGKRGEVGIEGASAGGLLMGAVTNMRPDLFKVVLCEVPFVDVMNTMLDASLPLTVSEYEEWGNPNQKAAFDYMLSYLPYDNVTAKAYPAILVQTSFDDSQVMYWEPSKYVAKLRADKTDNHPLVFFINMHGGHGGSSGRYDRIREADRRYAFMLTQLGITQ
jgi:protease II